MPSEAAKFCPECGRPAPDVRPPISYTPLHLRDHILADRAALIGERKHVTVLFCDIVRSTALARDVGPEAWHRTVDRFFAFAAERVHRYEGTVNQFLGDGFMALFGAPIAHEDHARRAVLAALEISEWREFGLRMGLNSGVVVVGAIGDDLRMDYTAFGETTVLAARLQATAGPDDVLVSRAVADALGGYFAFEPLPEVGVKEQTVAPFRVAGLGTRTSRIEETDGLAPFSGREPELTALTDAMRAVEAGESRTVGVVGDPGLGKTRLVLEFTGALDGSATVLTCRCLSYGIAVPYGPLLELVRTACGVYPADAAATVRDKIGLGLAALDVDIDHADYLLHALGLRGAGQLPTVDPPSTKGRTFDAFRALLLAEARSRPLVVVVEDLHWIDRSSEEFLSEFADDVAAEPILLLTTYRPGYAPPWGVKSFAAQIALRPLDPQASGRIVHWALGDVGDDDAAAIVERGEGNPFFLEELARARRDTGTGPTTQAVPRTVQDVLAARIDRLDASTKSAIQIASVLGREFELELLAGLWDEPQSLDNAVRELKRLEFVRERRSSGDRSIVFKHALTREVAYESLLDERRRALHERAGRALEARYADGLHEQYELLAYHYRRSADTQRAADYLELANRKAAGRHAMEEALDYFYAALEILESFPETDALKRRRLELVFDQTSEFHWLHRHQEYYELLLRQEETARSLGDDTLLAAFYARLAHRYLTFGEYQKTLEMSEHVLAIAPDARRPVDSCFAYGGHQWGHMMLGDYARATTASELQLEQLAIEFHPIWHMYAYAGAAIQSMMEGRWDEALAKIDAAAATGAERNDKGTVSFEAAFGAWVCLEKRDWARAVEYATAATESAPTVYFRGFAYGFLASALCHVDAVEQGLPVLQEIAPMVKASRHELAWMFVAWRLADAYVAAGDHDQARATASEIRAAAERCRAPFFHGGSARLLADIALAEGDAVGAFALVDGAVDVLRGPGAWNELALALATRGRAERALGRADDAERDQRDALQIFERLGTLEEPGRLRQELLTPAG
jgi:class 3 adenylate cyclase/tetratricopeptide (TPR) repeat protein